MRLRFNLTLGLIVVTLMLGFAILGPWLTRYDPILDADLMNSEMPPSWAHWVVSRKW